MSTDPDILEMREVINGLSTMKVEAVLAEVIRENSNSCNTIIGCVTDLSRVDVNPFEYGKDSVRTNKIVLTEFDIKTMSTSQVKHNCWLKGFANSSTNDYYIVSLVIHSTVKTLRIFFKKDRLHKKGLFTAIKILDAAIENFCNHRNLNSYRNIISTDHKLKGLDSALLCDYILTSGFKEDDDNKTKASDTSDRNYGVYGGGYGGYGNNDYYVKKEPLLIIMPPNDMAVETANKILTDIISRKKKKDKKKVISI